jgi:tetratricopeptide (TPR) repeat protein
MKRISPLLLGFLACLGVQAWDAPALAQGTPAVKTGVAPEKPTRLTREARLDALYAKLKTAENAKAGEIIADQIERIWENSGSDTANLMLQRAKRAIEQKNYDLALDLLDHLIPLKPDWAEAYHRRAIVHFLTKDEDGAMRDLRAVLAREPRHFQALAGLGLLLEMTGNEKAAYAAFTRAVEVHPHLEDLAEKLAKMRIVIEGQPL